MNFQHWDTTAIENYKNYFKLSKMQHQLKVAHHAFRSPYLPRT